MFISTSSVSTHEAPRTRVYSVSPTTKVSLMGKAQRAHPVGPNVQEKEESSLDVSVCSCQASRPGLITIFCPEQILTIALFQAFIS